MVDYLERRLESTKGTEISRGSVERVANKLYRKYKSTAGKAEFAEEVAELLE